MKKLFLLTKMLLVMTLLTVASNAWADETVGNSDNSTGYLAATSTIKTLADGGSIHYTFTQTKSTAESWYGWILYAGPVGAAVTWDNGTIIIRGDRWEDKANSSSGFTHNFDFDTFNSEMNGATVDIALGYNSGTYTMKSTITAVSGKKYYLNYSKTIDAAPSSLDVCLSVNAAYLTISKSDYYAPASSTTISATLDHTAGSQWGSNKGASTVDTEKERYNGDSSTGWAGCAYAKFSYSSVPAGANITNAVLTYNMNQGGSYSRTEKVYYMVKDFDLDWANFAGQTGTDLRNTGSRSSSISVTTGGTGDRDNLTGNVTSFVNTLYSAGQKYILLQWTDNAGGADLYGKGSSTKAPSLSITYTTSSTASYTVKYYETDGTYIKDGATYSSIPVGSIVTANSSDQTSFVNGDNKYAYSFSGACVIDGSASNVLCVFCTKESKVAYTITAKCGETNLGTIGSGSVFASDNTNVYWNKYIKVGGQWYVTSSPYGKAITAAGNTDVEYAKSDIYEFIECESTSYTTAGDQASTSASGGVGVCLYLGSAMTTDSKIAAGVYDISVYAYVRRANEDGLKLEYSTNKSSWTEVETLTFESSKAQTQKAEKVVLAEDSYIRFKDAKSQNSCHYYDYIVLEKFVPVTFGTNGFTTFASEYPLDLTAATQTAKSFKAYRASEINGTTVTFKDDVDQNVTANTGVLLKGTASTTVYIPVVASGTALANNAFLVNTTDATFTGDSGYTYYGMIKDSNPLTFGTFDPSSVAIPASKAYLKVANGGSAREIRAFFGDDITGISEATAEAAEKDGKFIINGQLVIKKNGKKYNAAGQIVK